MDFSVERDRMVDRQILERGVTDKRTLASMREVPRHLFMPEELQHLAYLDGPQPIGEGQTISQPYIVALMTAAAELTADCRVLEIGTGSGYGAAVASRIAKEVYSVERIPSLVSTAKQHFETVSYDNIQVKLDDGTLEWSAHAPYDAILVTAASPAIPEALVKQLKPGGRLIIPVGDLGSQRLLRCRLGESGEVMEEVIELVRFVPLIGEQGFTPI